MTTATPAPAAKEVADAPEGCPKWSSITAKTSDLPQTTFAPESQFLNIWNKTPDAGQFVFSNYRVEKDNIYAKDAYAAGDALVVVRFVFPDKLPVGVGNYSSAKDAKAKVKEVNISSKDLAGGVFDQNGTMEISVMTDKYACGKLKFNDGRSLLEGDFIVEVNKL